MPPQYFLVTDAPSLGYAFVLPGDGTPAKPDLFRDPADGAWRPYAAKLVTPFPPAMPPPDAEDRRVKIPDGLGSCLLKVYELDGAGNPHRTVDVWPTEGKWSGNSFVFNL